MAVIDKGQEAWQIAGERLLGGVRHPCGMCFRVHTWHCSKAKCTPQDPLPIAEETLPQPLVKYSSEYTYILYRIYDISYVYIYYCIYIYIRVWCLHAVFSYHQV